MRSHVIKEILGLGTEALVCAIVGVVAFFAALFAGANESVAIYFGLIVFGGFGAVALWAWAKANRERGWTIGVDIGTTIMIVFGIGATVGIFFFSEWLTERGFWGMIGGLVITLVAAIPRHREG